MNENQRAPQPAARSEAMRELFVRAVALHKQGRPRDAEAVLIDLLRSFPNHFGALSLLGLLALRSGRYRRAVITLSRAVELNQGAAAVYNNLGEAHRHLRRPKHAIANYDKAIALRPNDTAGYNNKAIALFDLGRYDEAIKNCDTALALQPNAPRALINKGNALRNLDRMQEALACYDKALAIAPGLVKAHLNRGATLHDLDRLEEALGACDKAISLKPDYADAHFNRGNTLRELNRLDEGVASYETAMALRPNYAQPRWNLGNLLLLKGDFEKGLPLYEHRIKGQASAKRRSYTQPLWKGAESIAGKTLFIYRELFLGDMIQFCRYAKLAEAKGAKVVLAAQNALHRLLGTLSPTVEVIADDGEPAHFDLHCPLMTLPLAFDTRLETIFAPVPYLGAEPERVETWKRKIGEDGIKVGICWQGSTTAYAAKLQRSFPLALFRDLSLLPGVRLISLQKSDGADQLSHLPEGMRVETLGEEFDSGPDAFLDSAAVMQSLDLVITTDTALAHLAGALGRPVWTIVKHIPDWRWLLERPDCPWYPSMRLFRQRARGDWQSAFDAVRSAFIERFHVGE